MHLVQSEDIENSSRALMAMSVISAIETIVEVMEEHPEVNMTMSIMSQFIIYPP